MAATKAPKEIKVPTSIRPAPDMLVKIRKIAEVNGLSAAAVINLALAGGLNIVEIKLAEIRDTPEAAGISNGGDGR